jgi:signal transduction histidine kinase
MYDLEVYQPQTVGEAGDVLVVDDNRLNLAAIEAALADAFVNVVQAQSGDAALRLLLDRDFSLILLDVQMPNMNGFETARLIRNRRRSRHTPIIFVTAHDSAAQDVLHAYELGAVDFLYKPLVPEILRAKAQVFVHLRWQRLEVERQAELLQKHERREHERRLQDERQQWEEEALRRQVEDERTAAMLLSRKAEELARTVQELEQVKAALLASNQELEDADRRKTEFIAVLAHELRNPLAPIVTGLELARPNTETSSDPVQVKAWQIIERQTTQLARLVDDLLDVSRINSGKIELRRTTSRLFELMDQAVATSRPALDRAHHELKVTRPPEDVVLYVDPVRIVQALANLLNNAARYTDPHGKIHFSARVTTTDVTLSVADNGRGLSPDALTKVFDMFVQERRGGGGLGIGLTLVKRLVELHRGSVRAESAGVGAGATFTIRIPREHVPEEAAPDSEQVPSTGPLRIALVEDNPDIRETMRALLESWGHHVQEADNGPNGVDLILRSRPAVALVDVGLPGLDGCQVAQLVRATLDRSQVRLIAMTGYGQANDRRRVRDAGFDAHLVKPVSADSLRRVLASLQPHSEPNPVAVSQ